MVTLCGIVRQKMDSAPDLISPAAHPTPNLRGVASRLRLVILLTLLLAGLVSVRRPVLGYVTGLVGAVRSWHHEDREAEELHLGQVDREGA